MPTERNQPATIAVVNARIWRGGEKPDAQALAVVGNTIAAVGSNEAIREGVGAGVRIIDAGNRRLIPGITDSHTHLLWAGQQLARLDLRDVGSKEAFIARVTEAVRRLNPGQWLLGGQYAAEHWGKPEQPNKSWLDAIAPDNPVWLTRADLHMAVCNSRALALAGVTRHGPPDPPGGEFVRDATGEPTGIVKDDAMAAVEAVIPPPTEAETDAAIAAACAVAHAWGITGIHDMAWPEHVAAYHGFHKRRGLTLRTHCYWTTVDVEAALPAIDALPDDDMLQVVGFKAFMDGSLGSRTAFFREPYADANPGMKNPRGLLTKWTADAEAFRRTVRWAHTRGIQWAIHAIGDQAVHDLLDLFEDLPDVPSRRHRIEHAQHLLPEDIARFARLGVIASMQPMHKADDGSWMETAIGAERLPTSYAWGSLLRSGARVCFGSDVPVATNNPFAGMAQAASGRLPDGRLCLPEQNITVAEALQCYTAAPAAVVFREDELGALAPGWRADFAILDRDPLALELDALGETVAVTTVVDGKIVRLDGERSA